MHPEAVLQSLRHVWVTLDRLKVPMAVTGGLALATWKHVRATRDVDLLVDLGGNNLDQLIEHLRAAGLRPKRTPPVTSLGELDVVQLLYEPPEAFIELQIDLLLAKSEYHREALRRRVPTQLPNLGIGIAVLACEDLILHKLLAGRLIDRADAAALLRANQDSLDWGYLTRWARELAVTDDLAQARNDAFPSGPGVP
jgi:hypothetical protein